MKRLLTVVAVAFLSANAWAQSCSYVCSDSVFCDPDSTRYFEVQQGSRNFLTPNKTIQEECRQFALLPEDSLKPLSVETVVYPNPANDELNIVFIDRPEGLVEIWIYDLTGRIIDYQSYKILPSKITFTVGYLPHGLYVCRVRNSGRELRVMFEK